MPIQTTSLSLPASRFGTFLGSWGLHAASTAKTLLLEGPGRGLHTASAHTSSTAERTSMNTIELCTYSPGLKQARQAKTSVHCTLAFLLKANSPRLPAEERLEQADTDRIRSIFP